MQPIQPQSWIPLLIALPVIALVMWRNMRGRRLRLETLWVLPAILIAICVVSLVQTPQPGMGLLVAMAAALPLGAVLGWLRGRLMRLSVDPETHIVTAQASPLAIIFILALVAFRFGGRVLLAESAPSLHLSVLQISDLFLIFAVGIVAAQRVEMGMRCWRMIAASKAEKAARVTAPA